MSENTKKIAVLNYKGGVGKTTTTINFAAMLADRGEKTLCIDLDGQASLSEYLCAYDEDYISGNCKTITNVYYNNRKHLRFKDIILKPNIKFKRSAKPKYKNIDVIASDRNFYSVDAAELSFIKNQIEEIVDYSYILFDCPPTLSPHTVSVLIACDYVIIPMKTDIKSINGFAEMVKTIDNIKENGLNSNIHILGTFLNEFNPQHSLDRFLLEECKENFSSNFIDVQIYRTVLFNEADMYKIPMVWYSKKNRSSVAYNQLLDEIIQRIDGR